MSDALPPLFRERQLEPRLRPSRPPVDENAIVARVLREVASTVRKVMDDNPLRPLNDALFLLRDMLAQRADELEGI